MSRSPLWLAPLLVAAALSGCTLAAGQEHPAPAPVTTSPTEATRLAVIGDFGTRDAGEKAIALAINTKDVMVELDGVVTLGDNVYPSGAPKYFDRAWTEPYGWLARTGVPVFASLGEHDDNSGPAATKELMSLLHMPGRWYAKRVGNVQLIVLDANDVGNEEQTRFLTKTLAAPRPTHARWRVVAFHQPAYSCSRHGSTPGVQRRWVPLFERGGVDLVLNGHDHVYQRFAPIHGVTYVVSGAAGSSLYEMHACPAGTPKPAVAAVTSHYVTLDATADRMLVEAISPTGALIDSVVLKPRRPEAP
ncbi:MAG: metallophosphoesterase [Actinomycetota bacterium]|nr:metallophosphoesterase [Actinomycetota bacterium]